MGTEQIEAIEEFEDMRSKAKLRALSRVSLLRPLTDKEFDEMMKLKEILNIII